MKQLGVLLLCAALSFCLPQSGMAETAAPDPDETVTTPELPETTPEAAAPEAAAPEPVAQDPAHPAIEPAALDLIKAMSEKLAAAKSIAFVAHGAFDVPARNGQPLFYHTRSDILLVRPNKLRVIVPGDGPPSEFYYDGSKVAVFTPKADLVAITDAPGNVEGMLEDIYKKAGVYFPFVDFIVANPYKTLTDGLTGAFVIGKSEVVGDTATDIVSLSDQSVHLQIWIGSKDKLPRLIWATAADAQEKPRHMVEFSNWKLDGKLSKDVAFAPHTKASTKQIPFDRPDNQQSSKE